LKNSVLKEEWKEFIKGHLNDDPFSLSLHAKSKNREELDEAILQIHARRKAQKKLPAFSQNFDLIFPPPVSVEQSSSELTSKFKASLFKGKKFVDLTGGMGVDTYYFSQHFKEAKYVEKNEELCELAEHNFDVLGRSNVSIINHSTEGFLNTNQEKFDLIYLDPSRRTKENNRVFLLEDCSPNILEIEEKMLESSENVLIKISPLADIKYLFSKLEHLQKLWVVAIRNECKELLCQVSKSKESERLIHTMNLYDEVEREEFIFSLEEEEEAKVQIGIPQMYIYEPNFSILKAGGFKIVGQRFNLKKLHQHSHLYTSDEKIDFPGRIFELKKVLKGDKKEVKKLLGDAGLNVISRNYPLKPDEIRKKYKLKSGDDFYLIATTLQDHSKTFLLCERIK